MYPRPARAKRRPRDRRPGHVARGRARVVSRAVTVKAYSAYETHKRRLLEAYGAIPDGAPVRLAKHTSNLFRTRRRALGPRLEVRDFDGVLSVDPVARAADVQGMTTYEALVDATL